MIDRLQSIIQGIMELWKDYQFVNFAKKEIKTGRNGYAEIQEAYRTKKNLSGQEIGDLWNNAVEQHFLEMNNLNMRLLHEGKKLTEMWGYGFVVMAVRLYGGPLVLVAGIASIINLIVIIVRH